MALRGRSVPTNVRRQPHEGILILDVAPALKV